MAEQDPGRSLALLLRGMFSRIGHAFAPSDIVEPRESEQPGPADAGRAGLEKGALAPALIENRMSRLHTLMATADEVAAHFDADKADRIEILPEVIEALPDVVVIEHQGRRRVGNMLWGFPRRSREMIERGDPAGRVGLVADLTNPLWDKFIIHPRQRCLIALTHFANPDGIEGEKTRTWFGVEGHRILAWAGIWRMTDEGPVCAGLTMTANEAIMPTNDRMPVLLMPDEYDRWLHGAMEDVIHVQFRPPLVADRMVVEATTGRWRSGTLPSRQGALL